MGSINVYSEAIKIFGEQDPVVMAAKGGAVYDRETRKIRLQYLNTFVEVDFPTGEVHTDGETLTRNEIVVILHYLASDSGVKPRDSWISFIQLPDGPHHHNPFVIEALKPLAEDFGEYPELFKERVLGIGGLANGMGDFGATVCVFPNLPIAVCLWAGDDEFPGNANILFDIMAPLHLTTADLYVLGIEISRKIRQVSGQQFA